MAKPTWEHGLSPGKLLAWREKNDLIMRDAADKFGVARFTYSQWEKGRVVPAADSQAALRKIIGNGTNGTTAVAGPTPKKAKAKKKRVRRSAVDEVLNELAAERKAEAEAESKAESKAEELATDAWCKLTEGTSMIVAAYARSIPPPTVDELVEATRRIRCALVGDADVKRLPT